MSTLSSVATGSEHSRPLVVQKGTGSKWISFKGNDFGETFVHWTGNKMWFTEPHVNKIANIDYRGKISEISVPGKLPAYLVIGSDGNLWALDVMSDDLLKITAGGQVTDYYFGPSRTPPDGLIAGPDGALWISSGMKIWRVSTSGSISSFDMTGYSIVSLATGPDGNIWFSNYSNIGKMTTSGVVTLYPFGGGTAFQLSAGPDGAMWFGWEGGTASNGLGRMTVDGAYSITPSPPCCTSVGRITTGPDGNLWMQMGLNPRNGYSDYVEYDLSTQKFLDPIVPPPLQQLGGVAFGFDGNIWASSQQPDRVNVYLWRQLTVTPLNLSIPSPGQTATLNVSETNFNGSISGSSTNRAVATVARGAPGTLIVTATGVGSCVIQVSDGNYNVVPVPTIVH